MHHIAIPIVRVTDAAAAEAFYCRDLGFRLLFRYRPDPALPEPCYMGIARDGARVHISSFGGDGVVGCSVYVIVDDVDALHAEFTRRGVAIDLPPTDQTWGNREMYVRDPFGNCLRFAKEGAGT